METPASVAPLEPDLDDLRHRERRPPIKPTSTKPIATTGAGLRKVWSARGLKILLPTPAALCFHLSSTRHSDKSFADFLMRQTLRPIRFSDGSICRPEQAAQRSRKATTIGP